MTPPRQIASGWEGLIEDAVAELELTESQVAAAKSTLAGLSAQVVALNTERDAARVELEECIEKAAEERQRADAAKTAVVEA